MKKITVKQRLVDRMIAAGNPGFTYTDVIKTVLTLKFGADFKYTRKYRGYYACAISGTNNYFMNGSGKCGLVKSDGLYYAKYFGKSERIQRAKKTMMRRIDHASKYAAWYYPLIKEEVYAKQLNRITKNYLRSLKMIQKETAS